MYIDEPVGRSEAGFGVAWLDRSNLLKVIPSPNELIISANILVKRIVLENNRVARHDFEWQSMRKDVSVLPLLNIPMAL